MSFYLHLSLHHPHCSVCEAFLDHPVTVITPDVLLPKCCMYSPDYFEGAFLIHLPQKTALLKGRAQPDLDLFLLPQA